MTETESKKAPPHITNQSIRSYAERLESLLNEKDTFMEEHRDAQADLMKEAKNNGITPKALKDAIKIKRKKPDDAHEALVAGYLKAIGFSQETV